MKEEFDFDKVGKRLPYKAPAGFFDKLTETTLAEAEGSAVKKQKASPVLWRALSVAASLAVLLLLSYLIYKGTTGSARKETTIAVAETSATVTGTLPPVAPAVTVATPTPAQPEPTVMPETTNAAIPNKQQEVQKQQIAVAARPETLEELLASISDEELQQLAAIVKSEQYVYEQTIE